MITLLSNSEVLSVDEHCICSPPRRYDDPAMADARFDAIDRGLVVALQHDGRASYATWPESSASQWRT
jgi:hypothetical protein